MEVKVHNAEVGTDAYFHGTSETYMRAGAEAALRLSMSRSFGARSCRALTWNASGAKRSTGISTWCSMARLHGATIKLSKDA